MRTKTHKAKTSKKTSYWTWAVGIIGGSMLGSFGVSLAVMLTSAPAEVWRYMTAPPEFPPHAVVLSMGSDCGNGRWEKVVGLEGRFLVGVASGQKAGEQTPGRTKVKLKAENIPSMGVSVGGAIRKGALGWGDTPLVSDLSSGDKQEVGRVGRYNNEEVDITPPGFALTVCKRKS